MKKEVEKNKRTIFIGKLEIEINTLIFCAVIGIVLIIYCLSPNIYSITTARYGKWSETDNNNVETALGRENTEGRFLTYFQWYNVVHELGHGILRYNSNIKLSGAEEEQLVNDFAVAYWLYYGEESKINELKDIVEYASNNIKSSAEEGITYMEFAEKNWNKLSFNTFNNYGWFQFSSVKESLKNGKELKDVLKDMGIENYNLIDSKKLEYPIIDEEVSTQIINDAINNFHEWGLKFPKCYHKFSNNPNSNYSGNRKNFLGIYNLIEKLL